MRPELRERILGALALEPMTATELALRLTAPRGTVTDTLAMLHAAGRIVLAPRRNAGHGHGNDRPYQRVAA